MHDQAAASHDVTPLADNLWVAARPLRNTPLNIGTRMTVVRLQGGGLWIHSPVELTPTLKAKIDALGPVRYIVAPNPYHHMFVRPWTEAYPGAELCCVRALCRKRPDLQPALILDEADRYPWERDLKTCIIRGSRLFTEADFLHQPSRTLIITDFAFNIPPQPSRAFNLFLRVWGVYNRFAPSRVLRALCRDRASVRQGLRTMGQWEFDRIILAHGDIVTTDARAKFDKAFAWVSP